MTTLVQRLKRNAYGVAAVMLTAAVTLPNVLVGQVHAEELVDRSIQMSTASVDASASYTARFTTVDTGSVNGIVLDFCSGSDTPLIGDECSLPTGMSLGTSSVSVDVDTVNDTNWGSTATTVDGTAIAITTGGTTAITDGGQDIEISVSGFTNQTAVGAFYARILTFSTAAAADTSYESETPGTYLDAGGVALSTTEDVAITARVLETLTFCVSAAAPDPGCTNTSTPSLTLGVGTPLALDNTTLSTATAYFQLNTNTAAGQTFVNIAGNTLENSNSDDIDPVGGTLTTIAADTEAFGLRVEDGTGVGTSLGAVGGNPQYESAAQYAFDSAISSPYGDTIASSTGPVQNINVPVTFAAMINNATPSGIYTTDLSLIATSAY